MWLGDPVSSSSSQVENNVKVFEWLQKASVAAESYKKDGLKLLQLIYNLIIMVCLSILFSPCYGLPSYLPICWRDESSELVSVSEIYVLTWLTRYLLGLYEMFHIIPWFERLWTLQEIVLNNHSILFYGSIAVKFSAVRRLDEKLYDLQEKNLDFQNAYTEFWSGFGPYLLARMRLTRRISRETGVKPFSFHNIRRLETSNPKDKVFAIQGLLEAQGVSLPPPDYAKPLARICREAFMALILFDKQCGRFSAIESAYG